MVGYSAKAAAATDSAQARSRASCTSSPTVSAACCGAGPHEGEAGVAEVAKELRISESCLRNWMAQAEADEAGSSEARLTSAEPGRARETRLVRIMCYFTRGPGEPRLCTIR
jgi:hypothetical protein